MKIPIRCIVDGVGTGPQCKVTVTLTALRTKVVGRATEVIRAGRTDIVAISLNGRGKHLLAARGTLPVSLVVTQSVTGTKSVVSHQRLVV